MKTRWAMKVNGELNIEKNVKGQKQTVGREKMENVEEWK